MFLFNELREEKLLTVENHFDNVIQQVMVNRS